MLTSLSKKETKELIQTSNRIENWHGVFHARGPVAEMENLNKMGSIVSWHHILFPDWEGGYPNTKITREKLTTILGFPPVCQFTTWHKSNVWGLDYDGIKFLIFDSVRGTGFQVDRAVTDGQVQKLIDYLFQILAGGKNKYAAYRKQSNA